jgi:hypothetical protein
MHAFFLVGTSDIHGDDMFDSPPVDKESEGSPATLSSNHFRGNTRSEKFACAADAEAVAIDGG